MGSSTCRFGVAGLWPLPPTADCRGARRIGHGGSSKARRTRYLRRESLTEVDSKNKKGRPSFRKASFI